ncbi:GQ67_03810T0 [Komagataella phaffii]|nr:GQ67_03810T0 [Komagataella phaffii]AOA68942.1 GQ68_03783T0 [Komagataella phaffii GS115]
MFPVRFTINRLLAQNMTIRHRLGNLGLPTAKNPPLINYNSFNKRVGIINRALSTPSHISSNRPQLALSNQNIIRNVSLQPKIQTRGAAAWKVITNIKELNKMLKKRKGGTFRRRLLLVFCIYMIANFLFNVMFFFLSIGYLKTLQDIPSNFSIWVKFNIREGLIKEEINKNERAANKEYLKALKNVANDNKVDSFDEDSPYFTILPFSKLDQYAEKKDYHYISGYVDLLFRYALTKIDDDVETSYYLNQALLIVERYSTPQNQIGDYNLKNNVYRTLAQILQNSDDFNASSKEFYTQVEGLLKSSLELIGTNEGIRFQDNEIGILPDQFTIESENLLSSLLDLSWFYTDTKTDINKSLSILLSILRSLKYESSQLRIKQEREGSLSNDKRLKRLRFELIPLIKSNIGEILWFKGSREEAVSWCREAAYESMLVSKDNYDAAKISKNSFKILARMYSKMGDEESKKLCLDKLREIEIPIVGLADGRRQTLRDVVLRYYFGTFGKILFP